MMPLGRSGGYIFDVHGVDLFPLRSFQLKLKNSRSSIQLVTPRGVELWPEVAYLVIPKVLFYRVGTSIRWSSVVGHRVGVATVSL